MRSESHGRHCSCCEGIEERTPLPVYNRPALPALDYRIGTHADFLESMLARLSSLAMDVDEDGVPIPWSGDRRDCGSGAPPPSNEPCAGTGQPRHYLLHPLTSRSPDDPAIALLDAWAVVADIMTFYQERIANEGYLRTALERRSVQELARLVGYELRPGVAASVYLAFQLEQNHDVVIPAGTRAQSVPANGEMPQPFETSDDLPARNVWNAIQVRRVRPMYITLHNVGGIDTVYLQGLATALKPNDPLLFIFGPEPGNQAVRIVKGIEPVTVIEPVPGAGYTIVSLQAPSTFSQARRIAARHLPMSEFGVTESATASRMRLALEAVSQADSRAALERTLDDALALARTRPPMAGVNLLGWLASVERQLSELTVHPQPLAATVGLASPGAFPFLTQVDAQVEPPVPQPADGSTLHRETNRVFQSDGSTIPAMITALNPRLADTFYAAWGSAKLTAPPPLEQVAALRVKAAPFGHNASPMPILDDNGALVGETEWPIEDAVRLQITLPLEFEEEGPISVMSLAILPGAGHAGIRVDAGGQTYHGSIALENEATLDLPVGSVAVQAVEDDLVHFVFRLDNGIDRGIRLVASEPRINIEVDDSSVASLSRGTSSVVQLDAGHRVTAIVSADSVTVIDENLLPPVQRNVLFLDTGYDQVQPESWVLIDRPRWGDPRPFQVDEVSTVTRNAYRLAGRSTRLVLSGPWLEDDDLLLSDIRSTTIHAQSEALTQVDERYHDRVNGGTIELDGLYEGLEPGRWIIVSGERLDIPGAIGVEDSELSMIANVTHGVQSVPDAQSGTLIDRPGDTVHTTLELAQPLNHEYARQNAVVRANVAKATHGALVRETIGSGDARKVFQSFALRQSPLTHVPAVNPDGVRSTLEIRVNDVLWPETRHLYSLGRDERGYVLRRDDDGEKDITAVKFGGGAHGARLPTAPENIEAVYRSGLGAIGNVAADAIRMLVTRPLGVKSVVNPQRASGGADRDSRDDARRNAPLTTMALDRLVSAQDYADFARMFAGVGKAAARVFPQRQGKLVHITIAGADDIPIDVNSELYRNLIEALRRYGDPAQPIEVDPRELMLLIVSAKVRLLPDYRWESVEPRIRSRLLETFGFGSRELGQLVYAAEVIAAIQQTPGVALVDLDFLGSLSETESVDEEALAGILPSPMPVRPAARVDVALARQPNNLDILPAQLAILSPAVAEALLLTELS